MDFCYVWLRRLVGASSQSFGSPSTRNVDELTGNETLARGLSRFAAGLSDVFCRMAGALKPGSPLAFTYHHRTIEAYYPVAVAILDAGLTCSASMPCPGEMGASIHINGTSSSIVDTIFVCRSTGKVLRRWIAHSPEGIAAIVRTDLENLQAGKVTPTQGDTRCIIFGHITRLAIWGLRSGWDREKPVEERLSAVARRIQEMGGPSTVERHLRAELQLLPAVQHGVAREDSEMYGTGGDEIPLKLSPVSGDAVSGFAGGYEEAAPRHERQGLCFENAG